MTLKTKPCENIERKGENADAQHFLLFPQCFLSYQGQRLSFELTFKVSSANAFNLDRYNILSSGNRLKEK